MPHTSLDEQLDVLRAQIETAVEAPGIAIVSSACDGDGTTATATGLAKSFAAAGHRTLLLVASSNEVSSTGRRTVSVDQIAAGGPGLFAESFGGYDVILLGSPSLRKNASRQTVVKALDACRKMFDYVIVDAAEMLDSSVALLIARYADTMLLTVREGRSVKSADHELMRLLEREELSVLGVVLVAPETMQETARDGARGVVSDLPSRGAGVADATASKVVGRARA